MITSTFLLLVILLILVILVTYVLCPIVRVTIKRRLLFKPFGYCSLSDILDKGMPKRITIECGRASYRARLAFHPHITIYQCTDGKIAIRFLNDSHFPVARIFHEVLTDGYNSFGLKQPHKKRIIVNSTMYRIDSFSCDNSLVTIYVNKGDK